MKKIAISLIVLLAAFSGFYTKDMIQKNPESLFLTNSGLQNYSRYLEETPEKQMLVLVKRFEKIIQLEDRDLFELKSKEIIKECSTACDVIAPSKMNSNEIFKLKSKNHIALVIIENEKEESLNQILKFIVKDDYFSPENESISLAGLPYTNFLLDKYSYTIKEKLFPFMFLVTFILVLALTRNIKNSIIIFFPALFSSTLSLLIIKLIFTNMNMVTSIVPLMTFVINLSLSFHLYYSRRVDKSIIETLIYKKQPVLLMIITTCIGFGSLLISEIQVIQDFGLLCSILILLSSIQSLVWFICLGDQLTIQSNKIFINTNLFDRSISIKGVVALALFSLIIGILSLDKIQFLTDATGYFPKSTNIKESIDNVSQKVVGMPIYNFVIKGKTFGINEYKLLSKLELELNSFLNDNKLTYQVLGLNSLIRAINYKYSGNRSIPQNYNAYVTLRSQLPSSLKESFPVGKLYRLTLLGKPINVDQYRNDLKLIKKFLAKKMKSLGLKIEINGLYHNLMLSQRAMIDVLAKSFIITLIIISCIAMFYFKSLNLFGTFLIVNITPVLLSVFILNSFGMSLNIATVMTYSVGLGIIVDSSFHIIHALNQAHMTYERYCKTIIRPVVVSSFVFFISFSLFAISDFLPIKQFGINLAILLFLGMIFDLLVLPTLYLKNNNLKNILNSRGL